MYLGLLFSLIILFYKLGKLKWGVGKMIAHSPHAPNVIPIYFRLVYEVFLSMLYCDYAFLMGFCISEWFEIVML
jgi:hypothetical protein